MMARYCDCLVGQCSGNYPLDRCVFRFVQREIVRNNNEIMERAREMLPELATSPQTAHGPDKLKDGG